MFPNTPPLQASRRQFLGQAGATLGAAALASLLNPAAGATSGAPIAKGSLIPRARRIIYLTQAGAPSHLDLFDPKPELTKRNGQRVPEELVKNIRLAQIGKESKLLASPYQFARHGKSGAWMS